MSPETSDRDHGLQAERTALAWTRTALAGSTSGVVVLLRDRDIATLLHHPGRLLVGGIALSVAACAFGLGVRRRHELAGKLTPRPAPVRREIVSVGVAVVLLSVLVTAYLLMAPG